jgi:amidophosphoribosyltransferase
MTKLRTLRSRLLLWVSVPLLALWVMSTVMDHDVASGFVTLTYDRALLDTALDLGRNVREANDQLYLDLPQPVIEMLISGEQGRFYYRANGPSGEYITGDISRDYLDKVEYARQHPKVIMEDIVRTQLNLNLAQIE